MLRTRVATASVLLIVAVGALVWSSTAFAVVVTALLGFALAEWLQLTGATRSVSIVVALIVSAVLLAVLLASSNTIDAVVLPLAAVAVAIWLAIVVLLLQPTAMTLRLPRIVGMGLAILLVLAAWFALMRFLSQGVLALLSVLLIVWIADTAAYFAGPRFRTQKAGASYQSRKDLGGSCGRDSGGLAARVRCLALHSGPANLFEQRVCVSRSCTCAVPARAAGRVVHRRRSV